MYAMNRNQMSKKTVHALKFITEDTRSPFIVPSFVDRMAAMLNYILKKLVGKGNKNFKVSFFTMQDDEYSNEFCRVYLDFYIMS